MAASSNALRMSSKLLAAASASPGRTLAGSDEPLPFAAGSLLISLAATTLGIAADFSFFRVWIPTLAKRLGSQLRLELGVVDAERVRRALRKRRRVVPGQLRKPSSRVLLSSLPPRG